MTPNTHTHTHTINQSPIRYESLDVWRGFACLIIVILHSMSYAGSPFPATTVGFSEPRDLWEWLLAQSSIMGIGVYIFFVLSGYCITAAIQNGITKKLTIGTYFYRRFRRIYFPFWIFLAFMVIWVNVLNRPELFQVAHTRIRLWDELSLWQWLGNISLTETWRHHIVGDSSRLIAGHLWTLCYEEQFYFVAGIFFWLIPNRYFSGVVVVSLLTIAARVGIKLWGWNLSGFFFDGHWLLFAMGIGVYYSIHRASKNWRWGYNSFLILAIVLVICSPLQDLVRMQFLSSLIFSLILILLHPYDLAIRRAWILMPLIWCGQMCYSLYLIHLPVVMTIANGFRVAGYSDTRFHWLVVMPVCVAASLLIARIFYHFIERRFMNTAPPLLKLPESKGT